MAKTPSTIAEDQDAAMKAIKNLLKALTDDQLFDLIGVIVKAARPATV
jgi:hypothetical protein